MTVTEIMIFEASDEYRNNPSMLFGPFDIALGAKGAQAPSYYGFQIENESTGYLFLNWDNFESHKALMESPVYPELIAKLMPCIKKDTKPEMLHVIFSDQTIALDKPVTEVSISTLKSIENREAVNEILSRFSEASGKQLVYGPAQEDANKIVVICGWETVEKHKEAIAKPEVAAGLAKLDLLVDKKTVYHTKLSTYSLTK